MAGIWADGSSFTPGIVIPHKTIETEFNECRYTREKVDILYHEKGFINTDCFLCWAEEKFFPKIESKREMYEYSGRGVANDGWLWSQRK